MKNWKTYQALELIPDEALLHLKTAKNVSWMQRIWSRFTSTFVRHSVPFVWKTMSDSGHIYWNIFDAKTGRTTLSLSPEEFETWFKDYCFKF
jgi:hypothetical protein